MSIVIDVSVNNTINSWDIVKDHVYGVILRLGYRGYGSSGKLVLDSKFNRYVSRIISLRIPWGVYFVTTATNKAEGKAEYEYVRDVLNSYDLKDMKLGIWCDTEWTGSITRTGRSDNISNAARTEAVCGFCDAAIADGKYTGIYASESWLKDKLIWNTVKKYHLWVANYSTLPKISCDMWQKTSRGAVPGVSGNVDVSELYNVPNTNSASSTVNPYPVPTRTLKRTVISMKGDDVKWLQFELNSVGYGLTVDGSFGKLTESAVKSYQANHSLTVDGKVGPATRKCLQND